MAKHIVIAIPAYQSGHRAIGGRVWVDPEINMAHMGNKAFAGSLGQWLRGRNGTGNV
jgi:hypothetical protein